MLCVVLPMVWAGAGPGCLIYLAALESVPDEMYEAADMDGASTWHKIAYITLPYLKPLIIINFVGAFIGAFQAMQQVFVMTGGGPAHATYLIGLEIWYNAFMYLKFGYATAEAWILGTMLIGFTVYQLQILKRVKFTTAKV
jgi:multiple sugar transport system permease protein